MMPGTAKSSVITQTKPHNVFYIWYTELCRRLNSNPAAILRLAKPKCNTILDFAADRLKFEDWSPLITALRHDTSLHVINIRSRMDSYQFLHEVDTEDKARRLRRKYGFLWTDFMLNSLVRALSFSIKNTQVLTCLELDGLPMFSKYLDGLFKALKENKTVKTLSLANCPIKDVGCRLVCSSLQLMPNVEILNLSRCELTSESGVYVAKLMRNQQLHRYTTSWHKSLRYSEPDSERMKGIRRITLNWNPCFGDDGLNCILDVLEDDLWIKALDLQMCGITENISGKLLDILRYNQSLIIADFRRNDCLSPTTLEHILEILKTRDFKEDEPNEFQWCNTVLTLCPSSASCNLGQNVSTQKSIITTAKKASGEVNGLKQTRTKMDLTKNGVIENGKTLNYRRSKSLHNDPESKQDVAKKKGRKNGRCLYQSREVELSTLNSVIKTFGRLKLANDLSIRDAPTNTPATSPVRKAGPATKYTNGVKVTNGHKTHNGFAVDATQSACNLFAHYVKSQGKVEQSSEEIQSLLSYCQNYDSDLSEIRNNCDHFLKRNDLSDSEVSLFDFMEELKQDGPDKSGNPRSTTSKHHYKGKKNGIK